MKYKYQGRVYETGVWFQRGDAIEIPIEGHKPRYIWPEQVVQEGTATDSDDSPPPPMQEDKPRVQRASSDGEISLQDICQAVGIEPGLARRILRKNMPRPEGRWSFNPAERDAVEKLLRSKK